MLTLLLWVAVLIFAIFTGDHTRTFLAERYNTSVSMWGSVAASLLVLTIGAKLLGMF